MDMIEDEGSQDRCTRMKIILELCPCSDPTKMMERDVPNTHVDTEMTKTRGYAYFRLREVVQSHDQAHEGRQGLVPVRDHTDPVAFSALF